jgi:hypothetical protein
VICKGRAMVAPFGSSEALSSKDLPPPGPHLKAKYDSPNLPDKTSMNETQRVILMKKRVEPPVL